jgi:ribosomal protein S18 acetylase RimI-like enzyme
MSRQNRTEDVQESIGKLRAALFDSSGKDKDVTATIAPAFMKYDRNDLKLSVEFATKLSDAMKEWAFEMAKGNMEDIYDQSGYGWDDDDKMRELEEDGARFLVVKETPVRDADANADPTANADTDNVTTGKPVAFVHFRFTVQGEVMDVMKGETSLYIWDIHVDESVQRKGVGKHLMLILELIARQQQMKMVSIPVQLHDETALSFVSNLRGFAPDADLKDLIGFDSDMEGFEVFSKVLSAPKPKPLAAPILAHALSSSAVKDGDTENIDANVNAATPASASSPSEVSKGDDVTLPLQDSNECDNLTVGSAIEKLRTLYIEKNNKEPTETEVANWTTALSQTED